MHPFVHSFNPAIAPPWQTRTDLDAFQTHRGGVQRAGRDAPGRAQDLVAVPLTHDTPDEMANPHGDRPRLEGRASATRSPGVTMPKLVVVERDYGAVADKMGGARAAGRELGATDQGHHLRPDERGRLPAAARTGRPRRRRPTAGRRCTATSTRARRSSRCPAPRTATWRRRASSTLEERTGMQLADLAAEHEGKQITFADTQARPRR